MKYDELIKILKKEVTDDMFETLVLNEVLNYYDVKILGCDITFEGIKVYTLKEKVVAKEFYLVINPDCKELDKNLFPKDKYMIVDKDEETLIFLLNALIYYSYDELPHNIQWLNSILSDFERDEFGKLNFNRAMQNFYRMDDTFSKDYDEYYRKFRELFNRAQSYIIEKLIEEKYMNSKKDWNKKTGEIKLTGDKGENITCYCGLPKENYVNFVVDKPCNCFQLCFKSESDIERFAEEVLKIIEMIKSSKD